MVSEGTLRKSRISISRWPWTHPFRTIVILNGAAAKWQYRHALIREIGGTYALVELYAAGGYLTSLPMWTLVIIVLTNGVGPSSGSGAAVSSMIFASEEQCMAAAAQIGGSGTVGPERGGPYQIIAKCIARSTSGGPNAGAKH